MAAVEGQATQLDFHQAMEDFKIMFPDVDADVIEASEEYYVSPYMADPIPCGSHFTSPVFKLLYYVYDSLWTQLILNISRYSLIKKAIIFLLIDILNVL